MNQTYKLSQFISVINSGNNVATHSGLGIYFRTASYFQLCEKWIMHSYNLVFKIYEVSISNCNQTVKKLQV